MSKFAAIVGRVLLALIFIVSGASKLFDVAGTSEMIASAGLPGSLAIPVGVFELLAGLCLALGFMVRLVALLLIAFTIVATVLFHNELTNPVQSAMALKNVAIIGGLCLAFAHSQMWHHYYSIKRDRAGELAVRDAERRAHEAELRAARAEGAATARHTGEHVTVREDLDGDGIPETRSRKRRWFDW